MTTHNSSPNTSQFRIRQMSTNDLPLCGELVRQAGWNQTDQDWRRAIKLAPDGCFVAEIDQTGVATTTTCCFEGVGWIAMVLVDKKHRGTGIAQSLVRHAILHLENRGIQSIRLDATAMGQGLYEKLGFKAEYDVVRYVGIGKLTLNFAQNGSLPCVYPKDPVFNEMTTLDRNITGTNRRAFISNLIENDNTSFYHQSNEQGRVIGYAGSRKGTYAAQLGPAVALTSNVGQTLLNRLLTDFAGQKCYIDIPVPNVSAIKWAEANDFTEQRRFVRMYRGEPITDLPELIWASSGPEKG
jgi:GNAT superfamily N-acetyltransferase